MTRVLFVGMILCLFASEANPAMAQVFLGDLLVDLKVVEKESAEAKAVRLKWIDQERNRIQDELKKFDKELAELRDIVPDAIKPRILPPAVARERQQEQLRFNDWSANNDPARRFAVIRGSGLNALLRVLGPIAHYRKTRTNNSPAQSVFPSLSPSHEIKAAEVAHFRLNPATSAGSQVVVRLNQLPLELEWPPVIRQNWPEECVNIGKLRDVYVVTLNNANHNMKYLDQADLLDKALSLLQAMVQKKKWQTPHDVTLTSDKRIQVHRNLQDAVRYLETVRATVDRFKTVPSDYKVHRFAGGSVEDFLDFCYTHGMQFQEARPVDEEFYHKIYRQIQDYAHDVQFVEDWKNDLEQRMRELSDEDQKLVWVAAEQ
jgi:hypothetical protein